MIMNERDIVDTVIKKLNNYTIKNDNDFKDYLYEIITELIDFYIAYSYEYYTEILDDNMVEIYNKLNLEEIV